MTLADAAGAAAVGLPVGALPAGRTYRARLVATNSAGTTISGWVTFTTPATRPVSTTRPKMTGTPKVGKTLTCGTGKWKAAPAPKFAYGWRIGGKVSKTQKTSKLKLTERDARQERLVRRDGEEPGCRGRGAQRRGHRPAPITSAPCRSTSTASVATSRRRPSPTARRRRPPASAAS